MRSTSSAVKLLAQKRGIALFQPPTLRAAEVLAPLRAARADALIVAAYGLILPADVLRVAKHGAINLHASLLPRWRGAAPLQRALLAGDAQTGVSIMRMDEGLDTGPLFAQRAVPIEPGDDAGTLHDKLADLGANMLLEVLAGITKGTARSIAQAGSGATYAAKIDKAETRLRWQLPAVELERVVRAFRPVPGALAYLAGEPIKIWRARLAPGDAPPGTIFDDDLRVACGDGALAIEELQPAGGRRMNASEFLRRRRLAPGARFE